MAAFKEADLEKMHIAEIEGLIFGAEQKSKEIAQKVGIGQAKPADMMAVNADLLLLRKVHDKKMMKEKRLTSSHVSSRPATPLKSYEDYLKDHK
jgi:hypothetical protein